MFNEITAIKYHIVYILRCFCRYIFWLCELRANILTNSYRLFLPIHCKNIDYHTFIVWISVVYQKCRIDFRLKTLNGTSGFQVFTISQNCLQQNETRKFSWHDIFSLCCCCNCSPLCRVEGKTAVLNIFLFLVPLEFDFIWKYIIFVVWMRGILKQY